MKLPKMAINMILKPMIKLCVEAYKSGKEDHINNEWDEESFEKQIKEKISESF